MPLACRTQGSPPWIRSHVGQAELKSRGIAEQCPKVRASRQVLTAAASPGRIRLTRRDPATTVTFQQPLPRPEPGPADEELGGPPPRPELGRHGPPPRAVLVLPDDRLHCPPQV